MRRDPKVFVLGEDVGAYGGAFGVTQGMHEEFGDMRVIDTPISESAIIGVSIGASLRGYRPVAEMQFADFISCGFDQIVNQAATLRYRYGGRASVPIVVRAPSGGNVGGGLYHSQNPEAWFIHRPGPEGRGAVDAVRCEGPAEGRHPRRQPGGLLRAQVSLPPREGAGARGRRDRADRRRGDRGAREATSRSSPTGRWSLPSLEAADRLAKEGVEVEVIDLRTLMPFDKAAIFASVEKTSRVLIVHEDVKTLGIGAELSAVIMEERFEYLDAPVMRVTYPDTHCRRSRTCSRRPTCRTPTRSPPPCGRSPPTETRRWSHLSGPSPRRSALRSRHPIGVGRRYISNARPR